MDDWRSRCRNLVVLALLAVWTLPALAANPPPTPNGADLVATAQALLKTATAIAQPSSTPVPTDASVVTATFTPTLSATLAAASSPIAETPALPRLVLSGWQTATVTSLCLDVNESGPVPQEGHYDWAAAHLFTYGGVTVGPKGGACDATLTLDIRGDPIQVLYDFSPLHLLCFQGVEYAGFLTLSTPGRLADRVPIRVGEYPPDQITGDRCITAESGAPFNDAFRHVLSRVVRVLWGK
jgi:hypothetical protein